MSTLVLAIVVTLSYGTVLFTLAFLFDRLNKQKTRKMLHRFTTLGAQQDLSFTSLEILGNKVIGIDAPKGQLMFIEKKGSGFNWLVVDLSQVNACRITKQYGSIPFLKAISLEFDFKNSPRTVALPFYRHGKMRTPKREAPVLEHKARNWESQLVKLITEVQGRRRLEAPSV